MNENPLKYKLMLLATMIVFGTIGVFRRYLPFGSGFIAMSRGFIGMTSLLLIMILLRKKLSLSGIKKNAVLLLISGILMGLDWILLFEAYNHTTVAVATLCYYMAPMFVILLSPFVFKENFTRKNLLSTVLAFLGMILVSGILNTRGSSVSLKGGVFGVIAAVFYAGVIVLSKKMKNLPAMDKVVVQLGIAAAILLPYVMIKEGVDRSAFTPVSVLTLLFVGLINTGISYAVYFHSLEHLPTQTVALFSYIDPIVAVLCSVLILSERIGLTELLGMSFIITGTLLNELSFKKCQSDILS